MRVVAKKDIGNFRLGDLVYKDWDWDTISLTEYDLLKELVDEDYGLIEIDESAENVEDYIVTILEGTVLDFTRLYNTYYGGLTLELEGFTFYLPLLDYEKGTLTDMTTGIAWEWDDPWMLERKGVHIRPLITTTELDVLHKLLED